MANHSEWKISLLNPAASSLAISCPIAFLFSEEKRLRDSFTGLAFGSTRNFLLSQLPWDPRHVRWLPREDVPILTEEVDELDFLFLVQIGSNVSELVHIRWMDPHLVGFPR